MSPSERPDPALPSANGHGRLGLLRSAPSMVRFGVTTALHVAQWGAESSVQGALRVTKAAARGESPADVLEAALGELRESGRRLLGIPEIETSVRAVRERPDPGPPPVPRDRAATPESLRARGAELLRLSADVGFSEESHPAYARILGELAPDEARILRLLAKDGPQPAVDVRTGRLLGPGSELVAPGLTMIGAQAGCRHLEQVPAQLNNLYRLGLIWFSREPVADALRYQVLEVQADVREARHSAKHARTVRRSILLTHFGADFCAMCLPRETADGPGTSPNGAHPPS
jgi:hypothetical protein